MSPSSYFTRHLGYLKRSHANFFFQETFFPFFSVSSCQSVGNKDGMSHDRRNGIRQRAPRSPRESQKKKLLWVGSGRTCLGDEKVEGSGKLKLRAETCMVLLFGLSLVTAQSLACNRYPISQWFNDTKKFSWESSHSLHISPLAREMVAHFHALCGPLCLLLWGPASHWGWHILSEPSDYLCASL